MKLIVISDRFDRRLTITAILLHFIWIHLYKASIDNAYYRRENLEICVY